MATPVLRIPQTNTFRTSLECPLLPLVLGNLSPLLLLISPCAISQRRRVLESLWLIASIVSILTHALLRLSPQFLLLLCLLFLSQMMLLVLPYRSLCSITSLLGQQLGSVLLVPTFAGRATSASGLWRHTWTRSERPHAQQRSDNH